MKGFIERLVTWVNGGREFPYLCNTLLLLLLAALRFNLSSMLLLCFYASLYLLLKTAMTIILAYGIRKVETNVALPPLIHLLFFLVIYLGYVFVEGGLVITLS